MEHVHPRVREVLRDVFGFESLRPIQGEAIGACLEGRDALVVMPTGGGKSLCYQVPPMVTGRPTLVISPLIALMKDQVDGLTLNGYPAAALHSHCTPEEQSDLFRSLADGSLRLLLAAPERAVTPRFLQHLRQANLGAIAIDEAHCISHWGHDFRPEYRRMSELREWFPDVPVHCFTATATERVRSDIVSQMGMRDPEILVGNFDRPNLTYRIERRRGVEHQIAKELKSIGDEAAIVYCISRANTETIAGKLRKLGFRAEAYHAGLDGEVRRDIQDRFTKEDLNIVVATVAFGMGIDRSNVRLVAHAAMPKSLEAYQQETGRAGRDGLPATCLLLTSPGDYGKWAGLMRRSAEEAGVDDAIVRAQMALLGEMSRYCQRMVCRHRQLAEHFGQAYDPPCGACDICNGDLQAVEDRTVAQKIMSCIARTEQRYGTGHIADVLKGSRAQRIRDLGHDRLKSHGTLKHYRTDEIREFIHQLIECGAIERVGDEYPVLCFGERGMAVMKGEEPVDLVHPIGPSGGEMEAKPARVSGESRPLTPDERECFEGLRALRRRLAQERSVPPYVIFSDSTLRQIAMQMPSDDEGLLSIKGIGRRKLEEFGGILKSFLEGWSSGEDASDVEDADPVPWR